MAREEEPRSSAAPQSAGRLLVSALALYRRYPWLFLTLAAAVIVPYQAIVLIATGTGPFERGSLSVGTDLVISWIDLLLITPLVSALHVHAVAESMQGAVPRLGAVARRGVLVLPVVVAASVMSGLGIALGLLAFIIPGIFLALRWFVVAQAAAIEGEGWLEALRRSHRLVRDHYGHVIVFAILLAVLVGGPAYLVGLPFEGGDVDVLSFLLGVLVQVLAWSLGALAMALLYFDLRTRRQLAYRAARSAQAGETAGDG
jgi:hypothetical protein